MNIIGESMMINFLQIFLLCLVSSTILGCGGQGPSNTASGSPITSTGAALSVYQFTARIDLKMGIPPFPVAIGDEVTGTFSFNPTTNDIYVLPTQGRYVQKSPAIVQAKVGLITLKSDLNNWLGYDILVMDNDPNNGASRDTFSWYVNDTATASSYGLDYIQIGCTLDDSTGKAFTSATIPFSLNINDFDQRVLFISGTKTINNIPNSLWNLRGQITSVIKVQ